jgi:hypothetical protein
MNAANDRQGSRACRKIPTLFFLHKLQPQGVLLQILSLVSPPRIPPVPLCFRGLPFEMRTYVALLVGA